MKLSIGENMWKVADGSLLGITTNGYVKSNGRAVMGRGCAAEAAWRHPGLPKKLGAAILAGGNHVYRWDEYGLITFPVKHYWWAKADLELIKRSCGELMAVLKDCDRVALAAPGCGNGGLEWAVVGPIVRPLLDNRVTVMIL